MRYALVALLAVTPVLSALACARRPTASAPAASAPSITLVPGPSSSSSSSSSIAAPRSSASTRRASAVLASSFFAPDAPLDGVVVIAPHAKLYPTPRAALSAPTRSPERTGWYLVYRVVQAPPGVVRVLTEDAANDCLGHDRGYSQDAAYAVDAFVSREDLVAQLAQRVVVEHADGTGAWLERGSILDMLPDGRGQPDDEVLAKAIGPVPRENITLTTPFAERKRGSPHWKSGLAELVCDPLPRTAAARRSEEELKKKLQEEAARKDYRACVENIERMRRAPPARPLPDWVPPPAPRPSDCSAMMSDFWNREVVPDEPRRLAAGRPATDERAVPNCELGVVKVKEVLTSRLDGQPFLQVSALRSWGGGVGGQGASGAYIADVPRGCGSVRVEVPRAALQPAPERDNRPGGVAYLYRPDVLFPRRGSAVTWPDGSPAGTVTRSGEIREAAFTPASNQRLCREVHPFAEPLCQSKTDLCRRRDCEDQP